MMTTLFKFFGKRQYNNIDLLGFVIIVSVDWSWWLLWFVPLLFFISACIEVELEKIENSD